MFTDLANPKIEHKGKTKIPRFSINSVLILSLNLSKDPKINFEMQSNISGNQFYIK